MRVALFYPWIYLKGGPERTFLEIHKRSRHEWRFFTSHYDAEASFPELKACGIRETSRVSVRRTYGAVLGASARMAATRLDLEGVDALLVGCDGIGTLVTLRNARVPVVNLCFTPLRAVYDEEYRRRHLSRLGAGRVAALAVEAAYRLVDRLLWRRYRGVICISETVRERVVAGGLRARDDMAVMYPGVDGASIVAGERFEPFFLLPGRIMWTKNIELGIAALRRFREATGRDYRLVIAGMVDAKSRGYHERLQALAGPDGAVSFHVAPTDAQMRDYYDRCTAVLFTAFNEDLGLTPMEAMARGKPVVAVNRGGPREVVEHGVTGYLAEPEPGAFADAMAELTAEGDRARRMGRASTERVKRFTWERFVGELDDYLEAVVAGARA